MFKYAQILIVALLSQETQAITSEERIQMRQKIDAAIDAYLTSEESSDAEWGFLKNIVNIDRFFAGPTSAWASQTEFKFSWHNQYRFLGKPSSSLTFYGF